EKKYRCLVVGRYAGTTALLFPGVEMGCSRYIDDYSLEELQKYPAVVFSGAQWRSKRRAEELVAQYAAGGGRAYVDLSGMPKNVLAKQPEFLGVYGETVVLREPITVYGGGRSIQLLPFSREVGQWTTQVPQVLDVVELEFDYYGSQAPVYGYKLVDGHKVWFLGGNLTYHALLTRDAAALGIMKEILGLETEYRPPPLVPLNGYRATASGYQMSYQADQGLEAIVPIAAMDGMEARLDGEPIPAGRFENLLLLNLPAGSHDLEITLARTVVYQQGVVISVVSLIIFLTAMLILWKSGKEA
ncbi:MAG: 6-pyruvoyl-tetrahydropterin synthase-related protein, partial [Syntrophomonadaceae bacterium]|nr:6-pyruvoyl-tetrahydropterin synthase-related protein [Syntrophomonadaceae bacterium]